MSALDKALQEAIKEIPECVAGGYVDMETGMLLGVKTVESHPQEVLELVAAATADLFQGKTVSEIERLWNKARGIQSSAHYFNEIIVFSTNLIHVFLRGRKNPNHAACFVSRADANVGMVLSRSRAVMNKVEAAV